MLLFWWQLTAPRQYSWHHRGLSITLLPNSVWHRHSHVVTTADTIVTVRRQQCPEHHCTAKQWVTLSPKSVVSVTAADISATACHWQCRQRWLSICCQILWQCHRRLSVTATDTVWHSTNDCCWQREISRLRTEADVSSHHRQISLLVDITKVPPGHGKSWNLGRPFSRPGKTLKIVKVMENDENVI